jgi:hypothetical protein
VSQVDITPFFTRTSQVKIGTDERRAVQRGQDATGRGGLSRNGSLHCAPELASSWSFLGHLAGKCFDEISISWSSNGTMFSLVSRDR